VIQDINDLLLTPIRESMKKVYEENAVSTEKMASQTAPVKETSVVMPSAVRVPVTPASSPLAGQAKPALTPIPPTLATPTQATAPKPPPTPAPAIKPVEIHAADLMLSEPTVSMAPKQVLSAPAPASASSPVSPASSPPAPATKVEVPKPAPYKADPYREPPE
jgi:hypothetical protein